MTRHFHTQAGMTGEPFPETDETYQYRNGAEMSAYLYQDEWSAAGHDVEGSLEEGFHIASPDDESLFYFIRIMECNEDCGLARES